MMNVLKVEARTEVYSGICMTSIKGDFPGIQLTFAAQKT